MSKWKKVALWKKILIGVVIGLIIGLVSPKAAEVISPLGDIFLRMLKMLIVPLVFFSITSGVCKMGDVKQLRTVGIRYVLWIMASAVIAAICGVIGGLIVQPGRGTTEFLAAAEAAEAQSYSFIDNVISWFPTNIVESMANANMLQIIVFCLFLGVALLALGDFLVALVDLTVVVAFELNEFLLGLENPLLLYHFAFGLRLFEGGFTLRADGILGDKPGHQNIDTDAHNGRNDAR